MIYSMNKQFPYHSDYWKQKAIEGINRMERGLNNTDSHIHEILIPRDYARMEVDHRPSKDNLHSIPHYTIYIIRQLDNRPRTDCMVLCKFPNSDKLFKISLLVHGGAQYDKTEHKYMIRETDELDRRIVLGFCILYQNALEQACYSDSNDPKTYSYIDYYGYSYTAKMMSKRLKTGELNRRFFPEEKPLYEHNTIFSNVVFI